MATVLCPSLVALDPVPCNDPKCSASHTHTPAFCDPCKAVHAQVHSSIHLASIGHRLRVDGPVAPVRCIVCCPIGMEPTAQYLFIGPEHYAVHARTSAHRAKLARLPKAETNIGLGRPGEYNLDRPYAAKRSSTMPSRSSTSMSFDGAITPPPGPAPVPLAENEYVLCTLCHTVLPVPPVDPAYARNDPKARIVSHGSDATVVDSGRKLDARKSLGARPDEEDDDHDGTSTILTTTDPKAESETRKYLVLAHHNAHDPEHDRRTRFPRFKEAWERRMRKQTMAAGDETPPEEENEGVLSGQIAASPSQLSLSSLSASPSVAVMGLDGEDVYSTYGRALKAFSDSRSNVGVATPPPPPPPKPEPEEEPIVDWESKLTNSPPYQAKYTPTRSVSSSSVNSVDSSGKKFGRDSSGRAFPVDDKGRLVLHNGNLPLQIPSHLLPFMSPFTPSSGLGLSTESEPSVSDSAEVRSEFKAPPPPPALPKKAPSPKPTASTFKDPGPPPPLAAHRRTTSSSSPKPRVVSSPVPRSTMSPQPRATPSPQPRAIASPQPTPPKPPVQRTASVASSSMSKPYQPSPSPPPRLAFDTYGRVLKLGMRGWEVDVGGEFMPSEVDTSEPPSALEREPTPEPPRDPTPEPEPEPESEEEEEERYGRPPSPATEVGVRGEAIVSAPQRYTLGQNRSMTLGSSRTVSSSSANGDSKYGDSSRASSSMSNRSNSTGYGGYGGTGSTTTSTRGDTGFGGTTTGFGGSGFGAAAGDRGFTSSVPVRTSGFVHTPSSGPSIYDRSHSRSESHPVTTSQALVTTSQALTRTTAPPPPQSSRTASSSSVKTGSTGYTPPSLYGSTGPTTKATRPVAARRSTGEWAMLEGQARDSGRDVGTGGWTPPVRPESAQSGKWAHTTSPDVLSAIGDEEESASGNSHSEASELIREFSGKTVASRAVTGSARVSSPTPERKQPSPLAPRTHQRAGSLSSRQSAPERPVFSSLSSRQAPSRQFTSPPPRQFTTPPPGQATPTGRPFSPSAAWNKLTPASPHSQSSSVDEFGGLGFAESSSFDEKTFLADLGFGLGKAPRAPSPPSSDGEDEPASPADEDPASEPESPVRRPESSARASSPDPSEGPVRPPSPSPARPSYHVRIVTPPKRIDTPSSRGSPHTTTPVRKVTPPRRKGTPPPARVPSPSTDSRPSTPTQFTSSASPVRPSAQRSPPAPAQPSPPAPVRSAAPARSMIPVRSGTARPTPSRNSTIRARAPSPLQREVQAEAPPPPPVPVPSTPVTPSTARVPTTPVTPSARASIMPTTPSSIRAPASSAVPSSPGLVPVSPRDPNSPKPAMRTRVRARPMGTSSSVISGHGGRSVVSGYGGGSVVSGYGGGSVVSGYDGGSVVSGYDNESVVSGGGPSKADSESEAGPSSPVVPQPRPSVAIPAHLTSGLRSGGDSIISSDSDALSSVVTPLSPRIVKALRERGFEVETPIAEERDSEVEEVAQNLAGMSLNYTLPEVEVEEVRMGPIELVDTHSSGSASPIAPEGAPSDAGSLFSRAASPKPVPTIPMFSTSRAPTMSTKTPPITPPKPTQRARRSLDMTPKSQRSAAFPGGFLSQPESPPEKGQAPGTGSVFSRGPESPPPPGADEFKWKLDLPTHSSDPLGFQSLLSGIESGEDTFGLGDFAESSAKHADAHAGEITNASPSSERLTPTRSAVPASETPLTRDADGDATDDEEEEEEEEEELEEDVEEEEEDDEEEEEEVDQEGQPGEERSAFTSSSEEGARTETDGLDHLTESIGEPFRHQLEPTPAAQPAPVPHQHLGGQILGPGPLHESPRLVSPPPLPGGFDAEFIEQPAIPQLAEYAEYEAESPMPDEVLALRPVICDACRAPMPFSKWPEHVARAVHRRNAARYAQWLFDEITAQHPAGANHDSADARERWAEASRLDPREAHPSEYAFCEVCQVFLVRGDHEHFQGKRHLRCLRVLALNDAAELESVRGSVSEEEDGPSIKSFRPITASQAGVDWTQPRTRSRPGSTLGQQSQQARSRPASTLGQQAFPPRPTA